MHKDQLEIITDAIGTAEGLRQHALLSFLSILFWKNGTEGYIPFEYKYQILALMDTGKSEGPYDEKYTTWGKEKGLELANKIRECIGLPQLTIKRGFYEEITPENDLIK
jgi:hypothetical protein